MGDIAWKPIGFLSVAPRASGANMRDTDMQTACNVGNSNDHEYDEYLQRLNKRFLENCGNGSRPLFTTDVNDLWGIYLNSFTDPDERQYHNCHACRHFIERFGSLVTISDDGLTMPAVWHEDDAPMIYKPAVAKMAKAVRRARVNGVFLSSYRRMFGTQKTGIWHHFSVCQPSGMAFKCLTQTAEQAMAEKREDFKTLIRAMNEFTIEHLETALTILKTESLYRSEKVLGQAEWLHNLHVALSGKGGNKANIVWRAVATAPAGFCHPRSSMIGTLLEDIAAGKDFEDVSRSFAAKMHPLAYQRPQAAPTTGAIAAAEKLIQKLGAAGSLDRRFARLDEVQSLWMPAPKQGKSADGIFGHLKRKSTKQPALSIPAKMMTWEKFRQTVLQTAERMEFQVPSRGPFTALVTAVNHDAPPILQWDRDDDRNPVSWYFWHGGSLASQFGLQGGTFVDVESLALKPSMWNGGQEHQGAGILFVLAGARESRQAGSALFPEILKSELHGIRAVIEAYSRNATIAGMEQPHAAGIMLSKGATWNATVRIWVSGNSIDYKLDRWD